MFFPACESLANENPRVRAEIERIDQRLKSFNRDVLIVPSDLSPFVDIAVEQLADILDLLAERGLLKTEEMLRCQHCHTLIPAGVYKQAMERGEEVDCTSCDNTVDLDDESIISVFRFTTTAWQYMTKESLNVANEAVGDTVQGNYESEHTTLPSVFNQNDFKIHLALSGGGLRATLFHLGVLRFLKQVGHLHRVSTICSVSGGSIAAAHFIKHWTDYRDGSDGLFTRTAEKLIKGAAQYGIRERIDFCPLNPNRRFTQLHNCYVKGLSDDQADSKLEDVVNSPEFHILGTNFATGCLVAFSRNGVTQYESQKDGTLKQVEEPDKVSKHFGLWRAVACSSAFPPMFPPHLIPPNDYSPGNTRNLTVGDGGVYDNLGIRLVEHLTSPVSKTASELFIVSDAGQPFRGAPASESSFMWFTDRLVRASDVQFYRLADADMRWFKTKRPDTPDTRNCKILTINIGDFIDPALPENLNVDIQKLVCRIRTDLDTFRDEEIHALIWHGWELARNQWVKSIGLPICSVTKIDWLPTGKTITEDQLQPALEKSSARRWRIFWPLVRLSLKVVAIAVALTVLWFGSWGMYRHWFPLQTRTQSFSRATSTIGDFPPTGQRASSFVRGFRQGLPQNSEDFFVDVETPFVTSEIALSVSSQDGSPSIVRSWAFTQSHEMTEPESIHWIDDGQGPKVARRGNWKPRTRIRIAFAVTNASVEKLEAQVKFTPR